MPDRKRDKAFFQKQDEPSAKIRSRAMIPLNTRKIHAKIMAQYKRRKKVLDALDEKINIFYHTEQPEYDKFCMRALGAALTEERTLLEELSLLRARLEKLMFVASFRNKQPWELLRSLFLMSVSEEELWPLLDHEVSRCEEKQREREEKRKRRELEKRRKMMDERFGFADDEMPDDELFRNAFKKIFGFLHEDDDSMSETGNDALAEYGVNDCDFESPAAKLKSLYRELCVKYHPDKSEDFDAETKRIWLEIQEAYQNGDIERLIAIRLAGQARKNLADLSCSEIMLMIDDLERMITNRRYDVKMIKKQDAWGFSKLSQQDRESLAEKALNAVKMRCHRIKNELNEVQNDFDMIVFFAKNDSGNQNNNKRSIRSRYL